MRGSLTLKHIYRIHIRKRPIAALPQSVFLSGAAEIRTLVQLKPQSAFFVCS